MTIRIAVGVKSDMLAVVGAAVDAGSGAGKIELRTGSQPANVEASATGTILSTLTLADPGFGTPVDGSGTSSMDLDAAPDLTDTADATGTAGWCRVYDSDNNAVFDGSVTVTGGGGDFTMPDVDVTSGQTVVLTVGALTF